ncbi:MAG: SMP-30/gluconolactonase/LRE family protein [Rhodobacteraceae bacterium]|nr:SMP-30/gluconolactonase/LRE family protein [Paracoccaceae bacterium]
MSQVFDPTPCALGEGPLWHPGREQLFWFDILNRQLLTRSGDETRLWAFAEMASAAGWTGQDTLLVASETALTQVNLETGAHEVVVPLEADNPLTRSNDGRADPCGGFWIGTMGKGAEPGAGAIYRYYRGEVRRLFHPLTIPNAICFTPDGGHACFADTAQGKVWRVALDAQGWPSGSPVLFLDLSAEGLNPDGAVIDAAGTLWLAQWGAGRVAAYAPDGRFLRAISFDAPHTSCPAFGGPDLTLLYCTSARQGLSDAELAARPHSGMTFQIPTDTRGQREHMVIL